MTRKTDLKLLKRIEELEAQVATHNEEREEQRTTRRGMLRLAGAAAVGGMAAAVTAEPAAADAGHVHMDVVANAATMPTGISVAADPTDFGFGCYEAALGGTLPAYVGRPALFGHSSGEAFDTAVAGYNSLDGGWGVLGWDDGTGTAGEGVHGQSGTGTGVVGYSDSGSGVVGIVGDGVGSAVYGTQSNDLGTASGSIGFDGMGLVGSGPRGALQLNPLSAVPPPNRLTAFSSFVFEPDESGDVWYCFEDGTPGRWRKLIGPGTAGAFHAIKPTRVYDSRAAAPQPGVIFDAARTISVADGRNSVGAVVTANLVPTGATAVAANITVTGTFGGFGYLAINPGGDFVEGASTINWFASGQTLANGVTLTLNATRQLTVICNGGGGTHFIVDIAGYYL